MDFKDDVMAVSLVTLVGLYILVCGITGAACSNDVCFLIGIVDLDAVSTGIAVTGTHEGLLVFSYYKSCNQNTTCSI